MEKLRFLVVVFIIFSLNSCCTFYQGCRQTDSSKICKKFFASRSAMGIDTFTVTPERFGVTDIVRSSGDCPDKKGGQCAKVEFIIGLQIDETPYQLKWSNLVNSTKNGEKGSGISDAELIHSKLKKIKEQQVVVSMVKKSITKVSSKERWQGNGKFIPPEIYWEKK